MTREVHLNELTELLEEKSYPTTAAEIRTRFDDVTLLYADGSEQLSAVFDRIDESEFESAEGVQSSIFNTIPVEGVGEPGQSEGEG